MGFKFSIENISIVMKLYWCFRFAEPSGLAPRKLSTTDFSPRRLLTANSNSGSGLSQCSIESIDDGFMELFQQDKMVLKAF